MKKLNVSIVALITLLFTSCSSDDSNEPAQDNQLIAEWNLVSTEFQGNDEPVVDCQTQQTITYNADGTGGEFFPEDISATTCEFSETQFTWTRGNNQITTTVNEEGVFVSDILVLNDSRLEIVTVIRNGNNIPDNEREIFKYEK